MKQLTMRSRKQQRGITLIEVSIGLIIAAILAAAAFFAFQANARRQAIKENVNAIAEVTSEIRTKFIRTGRGTEMTVANLRASNVFAVLGGTLINPYGSTIAVTNAAPFTMTWPGVPAKDCVDAVTSLVSGSGIPVTIGTTTLEQGSSTLTADTVTACGTTGTVSLVINL